MKVLAVTGMYLWVQLMDKSLILFVSDSMIPSINIHSTSFSPFTFSFYDLFLYFESFAPYRPRRRCICTYCGSRCGANGTQRALFHVYLPTAYVFLFISISPSRVEVVELFT